MLRGQQTSEKKGVSIRRGWRKIASVPRGTKPTRYRRRVRLNGKKVSVECRSRPADSYRACRKNKKKAKA